MIITRSPLRISLGGGGTDLASYYEKRTGFLIAGAIDKYVYISINKTFTPGLIIKYSDVEKVEKVSDIKHPIFREAIKMINPDLNNVEIISLSDIPSGTGLGSSGCFTDALIKALLEYHNMSLSRREIAEMACDIEINKLGAPIGKQDQYISAVGGLTCFEFERNGFVQYYPLNITQENKMKFEKNLVLYFTGYTRKADDILKEQDNKSKSNDADMIKNLDFVRGIGLSSKKALETGNLDWFGQLMHEHWHHKKQRSSIMTTNKIDEWYNQAMEAGAIGGKLIGAGGGGFLMFYTNDPDKLRSAFFDSGLQEMKIKFVEEGTSVVINC